MTCNPLILHTTYPDDSHRYEVWCKACGYSDRCHNMPQARWLRDQHKKADSTDDT